MSVHIIELPWQRPPMSMNDRMQWRQKASLTKTVRNTAQLLARSHKLPTGLQHATVALHWLPRDNRRRDEENPMPTYKAICDGLVDHGLVPDDTPEYMTKLMPVIHPAVKGTPPRMWLEITLD